MLKCKDGKEWASEPLHMRYVLRVCGMPISLAQAIKPSKFSNICIEIVLRIEAFKDTIDSLLSYGRALEEDYSLRLVEVHILKIMVDVTRSNISADDYIETDMHSIKIGKIMIKRQLLPLFLVNTGKDAPSAKTIDITHLDDRKLYNSCRWDFLIMI